VCITRTGQENPPDGGPNTQKMVLYSTRPPQAPATNSEPGDPRAHRPQDARGHLPGGASKAGDVRRSVRADTGRGTGRVSSLQAYAHVQGERPRKSIENTSQDLLQVRGREPHGKPQAQHGGGSSLLQHESGYREADHRDRRRSVGQLAGLRERLL